MTWGQLRFQLQTGAPGVPIDLLDEFLNTRYEQVLEAADWTSLKRHATLQTTAAYLSTTDTVTVTVGSTTVTGAGTMWTAGIPPQFYIPGDTVYYGVTYVNANKLTLSRPYEGKTDDAPGAVYPASAYVLMQNIYTLPADCGSVVSILDPVTGVPMGDFTKAEMDETAGTRTRVGDPHVWCMADDTPETAPPVLHQIEVFPPPLYSRGCAMQYIFAAQGFDGGNTSASPLPWVSSTILLKGCRADIATYLEKPLQATKYEAEFAAELNRLLLVEFTRRRPKTTIKMAERFTRHRLLRTQRGLRSAWGPGQGGPN